MTEDWRKSYSQFGCQWIEGEYLPCPGSVECSRAIKKGDDDKDEGPTYPIEVNYP
jgi:hypothetical protein